MVVYYRINHEQAFDQPIQNGDRGCFGFEETCTGYDESTISETAFPNRTMAGRFEHYAGDSDQIESKSSVQAKGQDRTLLWHSVRRVNSISYFQRTVEYAKYSTAQYNA